MYLLNTRKTGRPWFDLKIAAVRFKNFFGAE